ncbi:MAG: hypothetical protein IT245_07430 [Bacteroidia bacterium]|nr:hypothetical protein [Bacteroidia bacterium]
MILLSCSKKETIIQQVNLPQASLFGTWRSLSNSADTNFYVFPNDGSNYLNILTKNKFGFKSKSVFVFNATDKQVFMFANLYNYTVDKDTLILYDTPSSFSKFVRTQRSDINPSTWLKPVTISKTVRAPQWMNINSIPFGIDVNHLFPYSKVGNRHVVYRYNIMNEITDDSTDISGPASTYFYSGNLYLAYTDQTSKIQLYSTSGFKDISNNNVNYPKTISINQLNGQIYVYNDANQLLNGTENANFNEIYDLNDFDCQNVLYYSNNTYLCLKNGILHKIRINPDFQVLEAYNAPNGLSINSVSTDGTHVYFFGYDTFTSEYKIVKAILN